MKSRHILLTLTLLMTFFIGCSKQATPAPTNTPTPTTSPSPAATPDVVTTASIVNTEADFEKAISSNGTWIIVTLNDLTFNKDIVLDGEFKNGKKDSEGNDIIQRKVALYAQDEDRNITDRYTITAPKFTINSPEASIQHGTFKGDLYVSAKDFQLVDAAVDGNMYFTSDEAKSTFKMDDKSKVTGVQELKK